MSQPKATNITPLLIAKPDANEKRWNEPRYSTLQPLHVFALQKKFPRLAGDDVGN